MGGTSKQSTNQTSVQSTTPWAPAAASIQGVLGNLNNISPWLNSNESGALDRLSAFGQAGNPYTQQTADVASRLFSGGNDRTGLVNNAYAQYQQQMNPFASGQYVDPSQNPALQKYLQVARDDATNSINSQFAGAGRDLSGMNSQALGRGITQAEAPILYDAYNQARGQQLGAIQGLYGAGGQTAGLLSSLDQTSLGNQQAGIGAAQQAVQAQLSGPMLQLQAEAQRRGIPLETLAAQMGIALPAGQAFGTTTGTQTGQQTNQMSGAQQFALLSGGAKNLFSAGQTGQGMYNGWLGGGGGFG